MVDQEQRIARIREIIMAGRYEQAFDLCTAADGLPPQAEGIDARILYAGALALFGLGHILQSEDWIHLHGRRSKNQVDQLYLVAYLELHKGHPERALLCWTRILQLDPGDTFADRLIEKIRSSENQVLNLIREPDNFLRFVPLEIMESNKHATSARQSKANHNLKTKKSEVFWRDPFWRLIGIIILFVLSLLVSLYFLHDLLQIFRPDPYAHLEESLPRTPGSGNVVRLQEYEEDQPRFEYIDKEEALTEFKKARQYIVAGKVNRARYLLGKIELSNANFQIKERAIQLRDAIPYTDLDTFRDPISLQDLMQEPYMYRGAQLHWQARILQEPDEQDKVLRYILNVHGAADLNILGLYRIDANDTQTIFLRELKKGDQIDIFGDFYSLRDKNLILHLREIRKVR